MNIIGDDLDHDKPRSAREIAERSLPLHCVIAASHGVSKRDISEWLQNEKLYDKLSPWEYAFIETTTNMQRDIIAASWRVEAQVALLWSIKKIEQMDELTGECNTTPLVDAIPSRFSTTSDFIESSILRSSEEITEEYECIYDIHCEVRSAVRRKVNTPIMYDKGVVQERHYAFNWITGYCGQNWMKSPQTPD